MIGGSSTTKPSSGSQGNGPHLMGGHNLYGSTNLGFMPQDTQGAWQGQHQQGQTVQVRAPPLVQVLRRDWIISLLQEQLGPKFRPLGRCRDIYII